MKKNILSCLTILLLALIGNLVMAQADSTSLRIKAMGTELSWIVDDEYTDIMHNPAAINLLSSNRIISAVGNNPGSEVGFLKYLDNKYKYSRGVASLGGFFKLSDWNFGLYLRYGQNKKWKEFDYGMYFNFISSYAFYWAIKNDKTNGGITFDYDNGTPDLDDDWKTYDERTGLEYYVDNESRSAFITLGKGNWGFTYRYYNFISAAPPNFLQSASHVYSLTEIGSDSPQEAVYAFQQEINETKRETNQHIFSFGNIRKYGNGNRLDLSANFKITSQKNSSEYRRKKEIDYDPDCDDVYYSDMSPYNTYKKYLFQLLETTNENYMATGFQINTRYTKKLSDILQTRLICRLSYDKEKSSNYSQQSQMMEEMIGDSICENHYITLHADKSRQLYSSLFGVGVSINPTKALTVAYAIKWYSNLDIPHFHILNSEGDANYVFQNEFFKFKQNKIVVPIGLEYWLKKRIAFRLGMDTHFYSFKQIKSNRTFDDVDDDSYLSLQG
ncbi:MAG: hypothetical protein U9R19_18105, partial [Bacteroidota bacterium]|nr:hypothetical protein [Bacteroidota bacterium]